MADQRKAKLENNANSVTNWLVSKRAEFEQQGISEDSLTGAVEVTGVEDLKAAVDHLENREVVVRWPQALSKPPSFVLKPGRNWPTTRDKILGVQTAGGAS